MTRSKQKKNRCKKWERERWGRRRAQKETKRGKRKGKEDG